MYGTPYDLQRFYNTKFIYNYTKIVGLVMLLPVIVSKLWIKTSNIGSLYGAYFIIYHSNNIRWALQIMKPLILQSSPLPLYYLVPLRHKYLPQHPVLEHPQPMFLPQCDRPSSTAMQNNRQLYGSVYFSIYVFG
jgi:hypothetical protein